MEDGSPNKAGIQKVGEALYNTLFVRDIERAFFSFKAEGKAKPKFRTLKIE